MSDYKMDDALLLRYARQILLPHVDLSGQEKINQSHVMIVGIGGLGCPVAMYLAAAGVGHLTLVDYDKVELSNLQRQIGHFTEDIGRRKTESMAEKIKRLNVNVDITLISEKMSESRLEPCLLGVDVIVDATDNFDTRFAINRLSVKTKTALVSGAAIRLEGQLTTLIPGENNPCYQCLYAPIQDHSESCSENGVLAPVVGVIGSLQALEVIKYLIGKPVLLGQLLISDMLNMDFRVIKYKKDLKCHVCS